MTAERRSLAFVLIVLQAGLFLVTCIESAVAARFGFLAAIPSTLLYAGLGTALLGVATGVITGRRWVRRPALLLELVLVVGGLLTALLKADILSLTTSVFLPAVLAWLLLETNSQTSPERG